MALSQYTDGPGSGMLLPYYNPILHICILYDTHTSMRGVGASITDASKYGWMQNK